MAKASTGRSNFSRPFTRRDFLSTSLKAGTAAAFTTGLLPNLKAETSERYNVLFIMADDLRPLLGCYGYSEMYTPNIDALAERGTLFKRAYCQFPVCNPSRTSILTGLRPDTIGVHDNDTYFRNNLPDVVTLPQHFKTHGYHTRAIGKVAHGLTALFDQFSWSVPVWRQWAGPVNRKTIPLWQALDVADDELWDGQIANKTIEVLAQPQSTPFFLFVGFHKPHLPYDVPRKYYDLYTSQAFDTPADATLPEGLPQIAQISWNEIESYQDIQNEGPLSGEKTLELIRAYAASTSYMDVQVGRVLQQLDTLGLSENTVIVFVGDHGFHLGEHGLWRKNTLFEVALHSPLIISIPGQQPNRTDAFTELVDIYPTLCDACQLPVPSELVGSSLTSVIEEPTLPWKTAAFSQLSQGGAMGRSMRTARYRYTEWGDNGRHGRELYDYDVDPDETVNIADLRENAELVAHLSEQIHAGWQGALPDTPERISVSQTLPWDINNDGIVNTDDLIMVSNSFDAETSQHPKADVNKDSRIDIIDLLLVAAHFGESNEPAAPSTHPNIRPEHLSLIDKWLTEARLSDDGSNIFEEGIATLEHLINTVLPSKSALLPNYPNPFNPETWIPYDLARDANVHLHIYSAKGESVRRLSLGFQTAGTYRTRARAAYWDGRNTAGESVVSGIYFYTLQAGQFKATRRMVIMK